ncbi:MAG TPA: AAA family ATPase, partial [Pseudonocardia sp.]|nr:AAA family ATPase [Pseudonocardia sp.]
LDQLAAEERIVTAARQLTAPAIRGPELELLRVELAASGLGPDQVAAVAGIVSSGRAGDVLIGPAGTGKSYTLAALAQVWEQRVGGRVLGLATTEIAARNLAEDGVAAMNTARFLALYGSGPDGVPARERVGGGDLYVIDEAGMSGTTELAQICDIIAAGGKIVYTGDHGQLTSIGAGGMLALLAADNGAHELAQVHRFNHDWEKQASLRLRAGDTSVIPDYEDRGRLQAGTREQMQAAAVRAWLADTLAGKESLLIVGSNADAAQLSREIRKELIRYGRVAPEALTELGTRADRVGVSIGDVVQARQVDRSIRVDGGGIVANRATYTVLGLDEDGALRVRGARGEIAHLPAAYVENHLTLAYASTVHAAQSRTVETSHALLDEAAAREAAYVALSRGREANTAYLVALRDPDEHQPERLDGTAAGRLAAVLGNVEARHAAEVERRIGARDGASLAWIGTQWDEVSKDSARDRYTQALDGLLPAAAVAQVTGEAGWPRLVRAVREAELAGHHADTLLAGAIAGRPLDGAQQVSDVLRWRIRVLAADRTPEQHVQAGDWTALAPPVDGPVGQFCHELAVLAGDRQHELGQAALETPPAWALAQLGPPPSYDQLAAQVEAGVPVEVGAIDEVAAARIEWAAQAGAVAAYRELRGIAEDATSIGAAPSREQEFHRQMWTQAAAALGHAADAGAVDYRTLPDLDLYAVRDRWTREQAWAPEYVAAEMRTAYELGREYAEDAALAGARLATLEPDDPEWETAAEQLARSERLAELQLERARQLEEIHHARGGWYETTEEARIADEAARDELVRRGLPPQRVLDTGEQLELFDPTDVIEPTVEVDTAAELDTAREVVDEPQLYFDDVHADRAADLDAGTAARDAEREPAATERAAELVDEPFAELDDIELQEQPTAAEDAQRAPDRADDVEREPEPAAEVSEVEQLTLLDVEPSIVDQVGAQPLRTPEPAAEPAVEDST